MIKVAVVGSGYWGKNLIRNFHSLGSLCAICDKDPRILDRLKDMYKDIHGVQKLDDLLYGSGPRIDAIAISTPAATHYMLAKKSLQAGKHVFVEKPLSLTEEEGQELVQLAEKNQLTLMVGHILQYHPAVIKLKKLSDSGELGKIQYLYSNRLNIGKIRSEENILWSFAPHDISAVLMLLGEFPASVMSCGGNYVQPHVTDVTMTILDFSSGVKGHIFVSWLHPFKEQKLIVVGDKKMAVFDDVSEQKLFLYPHAIEWHCRQPVVVKANPDIVQFNHTEPLEAECKHFIDCISNGLHPRTDGHEGLQVLRVLTACEASLRAGGIKIDLSNNNGLVERDQRTIGIGKQGFHLVRQIESSQNYFVHESSYVDENVMIGEETKIWHYSHILENSQIGAHCNIGQNVVIGPDVVIGNRCKIQDNVSVYKGVILEDEVFCGPSMVFTNVYNPRAHIRRMDEMRPTLVKKGATLGANCTIVCGVTIGRFALIGAGAVVTKDVPDYALTVGNPAKQKGWMCACGIKITFNGKETTCQICGRKYEKLVNGIVREL